MKQPSLALLFATAVLAALGIVLPVMGYGWAGLVCALLSWVPAVVNIRRARRARRSHRVTSTPVRLTPQGPRRQVTEHDGVWAVADSGGFTTTDKALAEAVANRLDQQDPLKYSRPALLSGSSLNASNVEAMAKKALVAKGVRDRSKVRMPPCPNCGAPTDVDWINIEGLAEVRPRYIPGRVWCTANEDHDVTRLRTADWAFELDG